MSSIAQLQQEAVTDGGLPTDMDWRHLSTVIVPAANRRRLIDRDGPAGPDGWITTNRIIHDHILGRDFTHWIRIRWDDARLYGGGQ